MDYKSLIFGAALVVCNVGAVLAGQITISDGETGFNWINGFWYDVESRTAGVREDNEVENGCIYEQKWDLEGVSLSGGKLTMVGGFDFTNGYEGVKSGDLFIAVDGVGDPAVYGPAAANIFNDAGDPVMTENIKNIFGYDYVLDFDPTFSNYTVYSIDKNTTLLRDVMYDVNNNSNPFQYMSGGVSLSTGNVTKATMTDQQSGFGGGGDHYAVSMDLGFLNGKTITTHFTMGCGNDNLMGRGTVNVPEPSTFSLLGMGLGLLGLAFRRKNRK